MEASVRVFIPKHFFFHKFPPKPSLLSLKSHNRHLIISSSLSSSPSPTQNPYKSPFGPLSSTSRKFKPNGNIHQWNSYASLSTSCFSWTRVSDYGEIGYGKDKVVGLTVVLLGWLGAEEKHLRKYVEMYTSRGMNAVTFVVPVKEVLGFDCGKGVEKRVCGMADELVKWLEVEGERRLLFHTFSNTGWLAYGAILDNLQHRGDFMSKIKGCVVDSGGDPNINPQVWAAGFSAALLKKRSSATLRASDPIEGHDSQNNKSVPKVQEDNPHFVESMLLSALENFFSLILNFPLIKRKLCNIISVLSKSQPPCPQLYLYSTADKVIPFGSVEMFIEEQKMNGKIVRSYNFGSSPHVDHYRTFPQLYTTKINDFLEECVTTVHQK